MKKSCYLENVEKSIKSNIKWQNFSDKVARDGFIEDIITFCQKLERTSFETPKPSKTRHG